MDFKKQVDVTPQADPRCRKCGNYLSYRIFSVEGTGTVALGPWCGCADSSIPTHWVEAMAVERSIVDAARNLVR